MPSANDKFAAATNAEGKFVLSEDRLDWHLWNWARWVEAKWDAELAYTISTATSGPASFDDLCVEMDRYCANVTRAAINSLTPVEACSIFNRLMNDVFRFRGSPEAAWQSARARLARDLYTRGLV